MAYHQKITSNLPEDISKSDLERLTKKSLSPGKVIELRETYHLFSFVRNPLSRLYSCYRDKVVKKARRRDRCSLSPYRIHFGMTFDEFVHRTLEIPDKYSDQHFRSASSFLFHQGELLVDYVGKFEQFSSDWEVLSSEFGLPAPERTRRISGPSVSLEDIPLSRSLLARVIERYANDLDTFDYRNELESMLS